MYVLNEFVDDGLTRQFGPFASQDDAMNFAEAKRRDEADGWEVVQLIPPSGVGATHSRKELMLMGWRASPINNRDVVDRAAQMFTKEVLQVNS